MLRRVALLMLAGACAAAAPLHAQTSSVLRGDVNLDGQITAHDALSVLSSVVGKELPVEYRVLPNGDADANGEVTALDALVILGYVVGRNPGQYPVGVPISALTVSPGTAELAAGRVLKLEAGVQGAASGVTWRSDAPHVATVDASGNVTAVAEGSAIITAILRADTMLQGRMSLRVLPAEVVSLAVSPATHTFSAVGASIQLAAEATDSRGQAFAPASVTWTSSNPAVASVDGAGVVTAVGAGSTTISASSDGRVASARVSVSEPARTPGPVATVTVSPTALALRAGQTGALSAALVDAWGNVLTDRTVAWSSSNPAVATVSSTGLVTAIVAGTATVTGTSEGKSAGVTVQVSAPATVPVATVEMSPAALTLQVGETGALTATLKDAATKVLTDRAVAWSSSNPAVATVSSTGVVTAIAAGTATVTGTSEAKVGTVAVQVTAPPPAPVATVAVSPASLALLAGETGALTATLKDASAALLTDRAVTWTSSAPAVATVSSTGVVTAVSAGSAIVTATSEGKTATVGVTVTAPEITAASVVVSPATHSFTALSAFVQAGAVTKNAQGQAITGRTVAWSSSNSAIAEVDAAGKITARGNGTATITASADGNSATLPVTVLQAVSSLQVTPLTGTIDALGSSLQLSAAVKDANNYAVTSCTVAWTSLSPGVATVSTTGSVVAQAAGTALVTAACGGKSDTATVEVRLPVATPGTYTAPASITGDCSVDVSAALLAWIASVPDNSTLTFGKDACYNIDAGLKIYDRNGLTFDGNGSTFRRISRGVSQQSNFHFAGGSRLTIRNMVIRGANPNAGLAEAAYVVELENQHGIYLAGMQGALIEDVQIYDVFGDFIAMTHDYRLPGTQFPGLPNRDILIRRGHFERNGRMGVAVTHGERITLEDSYISDVRWSGFDLELDDDREIGRDIVLQRNRFVRMNHYAFINAGHGAASSVSNITVRNNVTEGVPATCLGVIRIRGKSWSGYVIEGNSLLTRGGGIGIEFTGINNATARGNTITSGNVGGCGQTAPVLVQYSNNVALVSNKLVGPWPNGMRVVQTSTNVTEEGTTR